MRSTVYYMHARGIRRVGGTHSCLWVLPPCCERVKKVGHLICNALFGHKSTGRTPQVKLFSNQNSNQQLMLLLTFRFWVDTSVLPDTQPLRIGYFLLERLWEQRTPIDSHDGRRTKEGDWAWTFDLLDPTIWFREFSRGWYKQKSENIILTRWRW